MALIKCPECNHEVSEKAPTCPKCGYPINREMVETEEDRVRVRGKNRGKTFLMFGGILFVVSMIFGLSTANTEVALRAKRLTRGLYGSEAFEWLMLRYVPNVLLLISIVLVAIGVIFIFINRKSDN